MGVIVLGRTTTGVIFRCLLCDFCARGGFAKSGEAESEKSNVKQQTKEKPQTIRDFDVFIGELSAKNTYLCREIVRAKILIPSPLPFTLPFGICSN
jgi:hypothetical protein